MINDIYFIDNTIVIPFTGNHICTLSNVCGYTVDISQIENLNSRDDLTDICFNNPFYFYILSKYVKSIDNIYVYRFEDSYYSKGSYVNIQKTTNDKLSLTNDFCQMFCDNKLYGVKRKIYS